MLHVPECIAGAASITPECGCHSVIVACQAKGCMGVPKLMLSPPAPHSSLCNVANIPALDLFVACFGCSSSNALMLIGTFHSSCLHRMSGVGGLEDVGQRRGKVLLQK